MSEPAWIGAGRGDLVGSATVDTAGTFTITAHGLDEGTPVEVDSLSGGATSVLRTDTTYFAINIAADTFQLVSARGDELITFGSTGGADVYTRVPHMLAIQLRRLDSGLLFNDTDDGFGAREGVHPSCDPAVSVAGTTWTVHDIVGTVFPRETATSGPYRFAHAEESGSFNPADGSQDRIDALYLQIQDDDEDNNGFRRARVVYAAGSPGADPDPPDQETEAPGSLELGTFDVLAGGAGISVRSLSPLTVASGGVLPVRDDSEGPDAGRYVGMVRYRQDIGVMEVWDGSDWQPSTSPGGWFPIQAGSGSSLSSVSIDLTDSGRFPVGTFSTFKLRAAGRTDGTGQIGLRINGRTDYTRTGTVFDSTTDAVAGTSNGSADRVILGEWSGGANGYNPLEAMITVIDGVCVVQSQLTATGDRTTSIGGGRTNEGDVYPDSLSLLVSGAATEIFGIRWEVEGYMPYPQTVPTP